MVEALYKALRVTEEATSRLNYMSELNTDPLRLIERHNVSPEACNKTILVSPEDYGNIRTSFLVYRGLSDFVKVHG